MTTFGERKFVRETEWMRVFEQGDGKTYLYESKFLVDDLRLSASALKARWPELSSNERIEFALAFGCHTLREGEDEEILDFLVEVGPEEVWRHIAIIVTFHPRAGTALEFLLERISQSAESYANYYQGIELLGRKEAIPLLRQRYEEYRAELGGKSQGRDEDRRWTDYMQCAKTLWTLTHDPAFVGALREGQARPSGLVRSYAARLLGEIGMDNLKRMP